MVSECWRPSQFILRKVKAHQNIHDLPVGSDRDDAVGNISRAQLWHHDQLTQTRCILKYLADLKLEHAQHKQKEQSQSNASQPHDSTQDWGTLFRLREKYVAQAPVQLFQPTTHPTCLVACLWGNQYADLVLKFGASPDPEATVIDPIALAGITWHELTVAFIVNTGLQFPTWIRLKDNQKPDHITGRTPKCSHYLFHCLELVATSDGLPPTSDGPQPTSDGLLDCFKLCAHTAAAQEKLNGSL